MHLPIGDFEDILPEEVAPVPMAVRDAETMLGQIDARSAALVRAVALDGQSAEAAGDIPLGHFFAAETVCFLGFGGYLRQPETPLGRAALRVNLNDDWTVTPDRKSVV